MAFDPTKPVEDTPLDAAEMRNQFNGLQAEIAALQQVAAQFPPFLTYVPATGLWNVAYVGAALARWGIFKRCDYNVNWVQTKTILPTQLPAGPGSVLDGDEVWWQVKFIGLDSGNQQVTAFSNVISGGPVP